MLANIELDFHVWASLMLAKVTFSFDPGELLETINQENRVSSLVS